MKSKVCVSNNGSRIPYLTSVRISVNTSLTMAQSIVRISLKVHRKTNSGKLSWCPEEGALVATRFEGSL